MLNDLKTQKEALRAEAKRARGLLSLNAQQQEKICNNFFKHIKIDNNTIVAAYWSKDRELDSTPLVYEILDKNIKVALPIINNNSRILKFAQFTESTDMINGKHDIAQPVIDDNTKWLEPDIFIIPLLAYDRRGYRLGYGGGYYDATLNYYRQKKDIISIGLAYARQACLFNLPTEEHDISMDWIITEQDAVRF